MRVVYFLLGIYVALGAAAALYALYKGTYDAAHSEFAGLPLLILALPWSWFLRNFDPHLLADQYNSNVLLECLFIAFNALALGFVARVISMRGRRRQAAAE